MQNPLPSHHQEQRRLRVAARLLALFEQFGALEDRRSPLPPSIAGPARRTLQESQDLLGPGLAPAAGTCNSGELFALTVYNLHRLQALNRRANKAFQRLAPQSYPRSPERE